MDKSSLNLHIISRAQAKQFGLKRYFTSKPCKFGHIDDRLTSTGVCRECSRISGRKFDSKRRVDDSRSSYMKEYLSSYKQPMKNEKSRQWYKENAESERERSKNKRLKNSGYYQMKCAERRLRIKKQTPLWIDTGKVAEIYKNANASGLEVDHIIPVNSKFVSGLHCQDNMQLLSRADNASKLNVIWPDMSNIKDKELIAMAKEFYHE